MACLVIWWQAQFRIWTLAFVASHGINTLVTAAAVIRQRTLINICENQTLIIIWKTRLTKKPKISRLASAWNLLSPVGPLTIYSALLKRRTIQLVFLWACKRAAGVNFHLGFATAGWWSFQKFADSKSCTHDSGDKRYQRSKWQNIQDVSKILKIEQTKPNTSTLTVTILSYNIT